MKKVVIFTCAIFMIAMFLSCENTERTTVSVIGTVSKPWGKMTPEEKSSSNCMFSSDTLVLAVTEKGDTVPAAMDKKDLKGKIFPFKETMIKEIKDGFCFIINH